MKSELFLINRIFHGMVVFFSVFAASSIGICASSPVATVSGAEGTSFSGNNSSTPESRNSSIPKSITDMTVDEDVESINLLVKANRLLTYTSVKQPFPLTIILYFSDTFLDIGRSPSSKEYKIDMSGSNIISSAIISEENGTGRRRSGLKPNPTSKIEISLKKDVPYNIIREGAGLKISFSKAPVAASSQWPAPNSTQYAGIRHPAPGTQPLVIGSRQPADSYQTATRLQSVYATRLEDGLKVFVGADGTITNYKVFTIGSPASIVFDIFNIRSPYKNEKKVAVDTKWVRQVRYFGYPDRLRLILDTEKTFLYNFSAYPVDNGLLIHVGGKGAKSGMRYAEMDSAELHIPSPALNVPRSGMSAATHLQSVYATQFKNGIIVTVRGDGAITDYKTSTIDNPPTIVFDMFNVSSGYEKQDSFPVDTQWVKRVRHESYPDRLRLFIDTQQRYLSAFSAYPDKNGLVIYVGEKDTGSPVLAGRQRPGYKKRQRKAYRPFKNRKSQIANRKSPAWVNQLEFVSEDAGKSKLVIGTTSSVGYDISEESDKKLRLRLINTRIPDYRQRPLIGPFETAVDRITPMHVGNNESVFSIDLLEAVPYFVEQTDTLVTVHFEASSIPPPAPVVAQPSGYEAGTDSFYEKENGFEIEVSGDTAYAVPGKAPAVAALPEPSAPVEPDAESYPDIDESSDAYPDDSTLVPEESAKKYTGEKIALDFFDTDIKNVFRILREVSGKNFAVDKDVGGKVTLTLEHPVPWDQVLDLVLKMNKLGKMLEGNIIRIATDRTIDTERQQREQRLLEQQKIEEKKKEVEPLVTEYIPVNYSNASSEIKPHLEKFLTEKRGTISVDNRTNMIIMTDIAENIKKARMIVERIDKVTPQVIIEAKVVEASTSFSRNLGTEWSMGIGLTTKTMAGGALGTIGSGPQRGYDILGGTYGYDMAMNLPSEFANFGSIGFNFTRIAGTPLLLEAKLVAMETEGNVKIISAPKILTLDNKAATITQGYEFPYATYSAEGTKTEFKNIDLSMTVTPHITPDSRISMQISIIKNDIYGSGSPPALQTKSAKTELLVNDGDTIVIGGIIKETNSMSVTGLPGLSKIPIIGWLFGSKQTSGDRQELLIFITPKIVQLEQRVTQY